MTDFLMAWKGVEGDQRIWHGNIDTNGHNPPWVASHPISLHPLHNKIIPKIRINTLPIEISEDCKVR